MDSIQDSLLSPDQTAFLTHETLYQEGKLLLHGYLSFLLRLPEAALFIRKSKTIQSYLSLQGFENNLDFSALNAEWEVWIRSLVKRLKGENLERFVRDMLLYRAERKNLGDILSIWFKPNVTANGIHEFPVLSNYLRYHRKFQSFTLDELIQEVELLNDYLENAFFPDEIALRLLNFKKHINLMECMAKLEISRLQWQEYSNFQNLHALPRDLFLRGFIVQTPIFLIYFLNLKKNLRPIESFYVLAEQRELKMTDNMLLKMRWMNAKKAVLIVGGFHKEGIELRLRAQNISYSILSPRADIEKDYSRDVYLKALRAEKTPLEDFFNSDRPLTAGSLTSFFPGMNSYLSPHLKSSYALGKVYDEQLQDLALGLAVLLPFLKDAESSHFTLEKSKLKEWLLERGLRQAIPLSKWARALSFLDRTELKGIVKLKNQVYAWLDFGGGLKLIRVSRNEKNNGETNFEGEKIVLPPSRDAPGFNEIDPKIFLQKIFSATTLWSEKTIGQIIEKYPSAELLDVYFKGDFKGFLKAVENKGWVDVRFYQTRGLRAQLRRWAEGREFWVAGLTVFYLIGYAGVNYLSSLRGVSVTLLSSWDQTLPFIPEFVWVYLLVIPLVFLPVFAVQKIKEFRLMIGSFLTNFAVTLMHFLSIPFHVPRVKFGSETFSEQVLHWVQTVDLPYNSYPSLHVSLSFLAAFILNRVHRFWGKAAVVLSVAISASTLFLKQHAVLDVISAFLLAVLSYLVWFKWVPERFGKKWAWIHIGESKTFSRNDASFSVSQERFPYYERLHVRPKKGLAGLIQKRGADYLLKFFGKLKDVSIRDKDEWEKMMKDFLETYGTAHDVKKKIRESKVGGLWLKKFGKMSPLEMQEMDEILETLTAQRWAGSKSLKIKIQFQSKDPRLAYWKIQKQNASFRWMLNTQANLVDALIETVLAWAYQNPGSDPRHVLNQIQDDFESFQALNKNESGESIKLLKAVLELAALEIELDLRRAQLWMAERKTTEEFLDFYGLGRLPLSSPKMIEKMSRWRERKTINFLFDGMNKAFVSARKKGNVSKLFASAVGTVNARFKAHSENASSKSKGKRTFLQATRAKVAAWFLSLTLLVQVIMPISLFVTASCGVFSHSRMPFSGFDTRGFSEVYELLRRDRAWHQWVSSLPSHHRHPYIQDLTVAFQSIREYQSDSSDENFRRVQTALQHFAENPIVRHNPGMRAHQLFLTLSRMDSDPARVLMENPRFLNLISKSQEVLNAVHEIANIIRRNGGYADRVRNNFWRSFNLALLDQTDFRDHFTAYGQEIIVLDAQGRLQFPLSTQGLADLGLTQDVLSETQLRRIFENESLARLLASLNIMSSQVRNDVLGSMNVIEVSQSSARTRNLYQLSPYLSFDSSSASFSGYGLSFWHELLRPGLSRDQVLNELLDNDQAVTFFLVFQQLSPELKQYLLTSFSMQDLAHLVVRIASNDPDGLAFLRMASRFSFDQSGELQVPYGLEIWRPILGDDVSVDNFLNRLRNLTTDYPRLEQIFNQLHGMGEANAAALLRSTRGRSIFGDETVRSRYVLGFVIRWRGSAAGLEEIAPIIWEKAQSPDYSNALDTLSYLRIEDAALARNYFQVIQDIDATTDAALKDRRTRDFQVALHLLTELYRRRLLPWADSQDLFRALLETPLAAGTSDYPYQRWLENQVVRRLRTTLTDWAAPMPSSFFVSSGETPTQWSQVPWQDVLIRAWVGVYFQEQGLLYPSSAARTRNIHEILNRFHADAANASSFLLTLAYAMEIEVFPRSIRERFPENFPSRHEFTGRGDTWSNGHFYSSTFSVSGHMSALRSEISHAFQDRVVQDEQERASRQGWRFEFGILSGEFEDRALSSALQRDIPYMIHGEAEEYVYFKMELLRDVLNHSQNRLLVIPLLWGIVNENQRSALERSIRLGERASDILERLSPSQQYYLGDRLYQNGQRTFESPSRTRLLRIDQSLLDAGIDRNDFQDQINNAVGIVALQTHGFSGLYDARLGPHEDYQEASSGDHEFAERLAADLVVQVLYTAHQERLSPAARAYVMTRAVRHIYRISNKTGKEGRVPLRHLIESITHEDVRQWVRDLEQEGQLEPSRTQRPRGPLEPTEDTFRLRRSTPERRQRDELGSNDAPSRRPSLIWMHALAFGLVLSLGARRKKTIGQDKLKWISETSDLTQLTEFLKFEKSFHSAKRWQEILKALMKNPHLTPGWIKKLMASEAVSINEIKMVFSKSGKFLPAFTENENITRGGRDRYFQTAA